jgi:hypothetical protein
MAFALRQPYRRRATTTPPADTADTRTPAPGRGRVAAARAAAGVGAVMVAIARLVRLVAWVVALVIVAGIVLRLLSANPGNVIVRDIHDAGNFLVGPFKNVFSLKNAKANIAANWGLAAVVYLIVGSLIASLIVRLAPRGVLPASTAV